MIATRSARPFSLPRSLRSLRSSRASTAAHGRGAKRPPRLGPIGIVAWGLACAGVAVDCGGKTGSDGGGASAGGAPSAGESGKAGRDRSANGGVAGESLAEDGGSGRVTNGGQGGAAGVEVRVGTVMTIGGETLPAEHVELILAHTWDIGDDLIDSYLVFFWDYDDPGREGDEQSIRVGIGLPTLAPGTYTYPGDELERGPSHWDTFGVVSTTTPLTIDRAEIVVCNEGAIVSIGAEFELTSLEDDALAVFVRGAFEIPAP